MPTSYPTLPDLSDDEFRMRFGDNQDALRRYRLLHALLIDDIGQREAAEAAGISERTIRNILRDFRHSGMNSLVRRRSPKRQNAPQRWASFEPAMSAALAEEPQAGGDRIWRRAQEHLGEQGEALSRRTAYRILARLRTEGQQQEQDDDLFGEVRAALSLLMEDPPLTLGTCVLAQRTLPSGDDTLTRGSLLRQALRAALDRLRPAGEISAIDRDWWPYLICTGEYEAGQSRTELQHDLALSASTYSRAKRQGLQQITNALPQIITSLTEAPTVLASQRLPRIPDFVGRREEQSYYAWRLQTEGIACIWGLAGSGKTALAAEMAAEGRRYGQTILWHSCHSGVDASSIGICRALLQALGYHAPAENRAELPAEHWIELLHEHLQARPSVLVVDNAHLTNESDIAALWNMLASMAKRGTTRILIVSRARPNFGDWPALRGLQEREARLLWAGLPILPDEQWHALYAATDGLPQLLRAVASAYRRAGELARPEDWREDVAHWVHETIWQRMPEEAHHLLAVVQYLHGRTWADHAAILLKTLDIQPEALDKSLIRGVLLKSDGQLSVHPILRATANAYLNEDTRLRNLLAALSATIAEAAETNSPAIEWLVPEPHSEPPAGLELLVRLRETLAEGAAYLQRTHHDTATHRLAGELARLQAALPDPSGLPRPFVMPVQN